MFVPNQLRMRANNMLTMVDVARKYGNRTPYVIRELNRDVQMILSYDILSERYNVVLRQLGDYPTPEHVALAAAAFGLDIDTVVPERYRHVEKRPDGRAGATWHCQRFAWRETPPAGAPGPITATCEA